jgi:hypothetical protein
LNKTIKKVEIPEKGVVHKQFEILQEIKHYYETLYQNADAKLCDVDLSSIIHLPDIPKLDLKKTLDIDKKY